MPPLATVARLPRRLAAYLEFSNTRHFIAWAVLCGVLTAFTLVHSRFIDFHGSFCLDGARVPSKGALPGECFYFLKRTPAQLGIRVHLALVLPAALLACLQFVPRIRHKAIQVHRVNGRITLILGLLGALGVFPTLRHAFGGDPAAQAAGGTMTVLFIGAQLIAYWNVKHHRIRQHQAWMTRSWVYASGVITMRVIMFFSAIMVTIRGGYFMAQPCDKIDFVLRGRAETLKRYPGCEPFYTGEIPDQHVAVRAKITGPDVMQVLTAFNITYGMSSWLAFIIHVVGVDIYLRLSTQKLKD